MANKDYNGASLPDIGSVWDKETYEYATIIHEATTSDGDYRYLLILSDSKAYIAEDDETLVRISGGNFAFYVCETGEWTLDGENDGADDYCDFYAEELWWTNHDVLNPDGSVYFEGSVAIYDKKSFLLGLAAGLSCKGGWG